MSGLQGATELTASGMRRAWWRSTTPRAWRALALAGLGLMFDVFDTFRLALTLPAIVAVCGLRKAEAGAIGSVLAAGLVSGGIAMGRVADRIGRVRTHGYASRLLRADYFSTDYAMMATGNKPFFQK